MAKASPLRRASPFMSFTKTAAVVAMTTTTAPQHSVTVPDRKYRMLTHLKRPVMENSTS
jgi:hypothetical protein